MSWVLGIDLGTSFTAAGLVSGQRLEPLALGAHASAIPSAVYSSDGDTVVGEAALARADVHPDRLSIEFKRQFGESAPLLSGQTFVTPEELENALGSWVFQRACELEGSSPSEVVFTFPAFWGAYRRDLFLRIARQIVADPDKVTVLTEPEAAAIYYAKRDRLEPGAIVGVYDLGGGTFDASILQKTDGGFEVLGRPAGDDQLGGVDFDLLLLQYVIDQAGLAFDRLDRDNAQTVREMMHLRRNVTLAKELLSSGLTTEVPVAVGSVQTTVHLTRRELEQLVQPLITRTVAVFETALAYADVKANQLHSILLVGAASRMPKIAETLSAHFGTSIALDSHPKFAVCLGAAMSAQSEEQRASLPPPIGLAPGQPFPPPTGAAIAAAAAGAPAPAAPTKKRRPWIPILIAAVVVVALAVVGGVVLFGGGGGAGATAVQVPATQGFTDTGIVLAQGDVVTVDASGTIHHAPGPADTAGPDGVDVPAFSIYNLPDDGSVLDAPHASLAGKVGDGRPFEIGSHATFTAATPGRLYLAVNDSGVQNNSGAFEARISVHHP